MNKLNLPPFYIGQKVVYITGISMPKNSIHTVRNIFRWPCGCWNVLIDTKSPSEGNRLAIGCGDCGKIFTPQYLYLGWDVNSFRPLEELKAPMLTFQQIKETEKEEVLILN